VLAKVLLGVMLATQADTPTIRGFGTNPTIGALSDMGTFDGKAEQSGTQQ
jgi:hypothetical protein